MIKNLILSRNYGGWVELYEPQKSFLELLASVFQDSAFTVGTGIGAVLVEKERYSPMLV